jgi:glycosyltransferase involved in cell wall biosynthesis
MRVTFVSFDDDPPQGGQGVVLHGMREALKRRNVHAHTVSGRGTHRVPYARVTGRAPLDLSLQVNRNRSILYRDEPDLIHAFGGPGGVLVWRRLLVPLVYTAHHTYRQAFRRTSPRRVLSPLEARAYRRAAKVLPVSKSTADAVMALGVPANRIEVVPNGIEMPAVDGVQREPGRLLFVGRLEAEKGVLDALSVMESIGRERGDVQGIIVGTGRLRETVTAHVAHSQGRIEYLGSIDGGQLAREYARAALVLVPSRYEGLGMVALEAQLCGAPVAGYDVDGLRDAISEGGVLVPPGDIAGLRQAAAALLDEPVRRAEMAARGRERVEREHSWDQVGERLQAIYAEVLHAA